jgi:hypothetical protein
VGRRAVASRGTPAASDLFSAAGEVEPGRTAAPATVETEVEVKIAERIFCFTGQFDFGLKESLEAETEDRGGDTRASVTKVVDYLVVGGASRAGAMLKDARLKAATRVRQHGSPIHVVSERQWAEAIAREDAAMKARTTVPSIVAQVWKSLRQEAKEKFEAERAKNAKARRRKVPRPVVRASHASLCFRDQNFLERVSQYDYEFSNDEFLAFADRRGVLQLAGERGSRRWEYFARHRLTREEYLADPYSQLAAPYEGRQHRYTDEERESNWGVIAYGRAALQDCWEVFLNVQEAE